MTISRSRIILANLAIGTSLGLAFACAGSDTGGGSGGASTSGGAANPGAGTSFGGSTVAGSGTTAGNGSAGLAAGGTGTGGTTGTAGTTAMAGAPTAVTKDCATKTTVVTPLLTNFESYDGVAPLTSWTFNVNQMAYAGLYPLSEDGPTAGTPPTTYSLGMGPGANSSARAVVAANSATMSWGGGFGFWMGCLNASSFSGVSFWMRGTAPLTGVANTGEPPTMAPQARFTIAMEETTPPSATNPAAGGTCDYGAGCASPTATFEVPAEWTQIRLPWSAFIGGIGSAGAAVPAAGNNISGMSFTVAIPYEQNPTDPTLYDHPVPSMFSLELDDLGFY